MLFSNIIKKTKAVKSLDITSKEISFDKIAEFEAVLPSETWTRCAQWFLAFTCKKGDSRYLSWNFWNPVDMSPIAAMGFYKTGAFMLAIADEREIIFLQETDLETKWFRIIF